MTIDTSTRLVDLPDNIAEALDALPADVLDFDLVHPDDIGPAMLAAAREHGHHATIGHVRERLYAKRFALLDLVQATQRAIPHMDADDVWRAALPAMVRGLRRRLALD